MTRTESHRRLQFTVSIFTCFILCLSLPSCEVESPSSITDDWKISTSEAQGFDKSVLLELTNRIQAGTYGEIHSLLIVRHGYLVLEEYYRGYDRNRIHPVYSVTKSVTSALIGIAMDQGKLKGTDGKLLAFFPEYTSVANLDANKQAITLADVLTMRAGFDWNEQIAPYGDPRNPTYQLAASSDWIKYMLDLPMSDRPGTRFRYNSGCSVLLGGILRNATGVQAHEFARNYLFQPLGIVNVQWETGAQGLTNTGWGLSMQPRDMAKIGFLYLKNGLWESKRIISEDWVKTSTENHVDLSDPFSYGYQWWLMPLENVAGHSPQADDIKIAWGWGDQFIFVIPSLDMVVVSTAGNFYGPLEDQAIDFLRDYIVRAVKDAQPR